MQTKSKVPYKTCNFRFYHVIFFKKIFFGGEGVNKRTGEKLYVKCHSHSQIQPDVRQMIYVNTSLSSLYTGLDIDKLEYLDLNIHIESYTHN